MFKRSRRKIVATIMSILVLLWVGTLSVIFSSSYFEMSKQNKEMLKAHSDMYSVSSKTSDASHNAPLPNGRNAEFEPQFADSPRFRLSTFYTVALSYDGEILEIKNEPPTVHTDDSLKKIAQKIAEGDKNTGTENNLAFYKADKGGYTLVTFMDNTLINESAATLIARLKLITMHIKMSLFAEKATLR